MSQEASNFTLTFFYRLDRLTSGLLLFGRNPKKAREMEQQIRTRQVQKEYVCRVEGEFPTWVNSPETKLSYLALPTYIQGDFAISSAFNEMSDILGKYWYYFHCPKNVLRSILSFVFWIFPPSDTAVQLESADSKQNAISKVVKGRWAI